MKSQIFLLTILLGLSLNAKAQSETITSTTHIAPKETLSSFQITPLVGYSNTGYAGIKGLNGGSFDDQQFPRAGMAVLIGKGRWQFETGLVYTTIGSKFSYTDNSNSTALQIKSQSSYIDLPLLARWTFLGDSRYRLYLSGGVVPAYLVDSKVDIASTYLNSNDSSSRKSFHDTDVRAALGIGGLYNFSNTISMSASVDYQEGLAKLNTNELYDGVDVHSRSLGLTLGLGIRI